MHVRISEVVPWDVAQLRVHDASGIDEPGKHKWYRHNNIYYPIVHKAKPVMVVHEF